MVAQIVFRTETLRNENRGVMREPSVIKVVPLDNYKLLLTFKNKEKRIFEKIALEFN